MRFFKKVAMFWSAVNRLLIRVLAGLGNIYTDEALNLAVYLHEAACNIDEGQSTGYYLPFELLNEGIIVREPARWVLPEG
jgi:formamidopyrimidine-DNA glycosylase